MFSLPKTKSFKLGLFVAILEAMSAIALIATSAFLISRASEQPPVLYLMMAVVGVRAFALGRAFFRYVQRLALHDATFTHVSQLRPVIFEKLATLSPSVSGGSTGRNLGRVIDQVDELQNFPIRVFGPLVQALSAVVLGALIIGVFFPLSALWTILLGVIAFASSQFLAGRLASKSESIRFELNNQLRAQLVEYLQAADVIHAYGWERQFQDEIEKTTKRIEKLDANAAISAGVSGSIFSLFAVLAAALSGLAAVPLLGAVPGFMLAVAVLTPLAIFELLAIAGNSQVSFARYRSARADLHELMSTPPSNCLVVQEGTKELSAFQSLSLNGSVDYGSRRVDLPTLEVSGGEFLSISGPSGSGKSTLGFVMASLYSAEGSFEINDQPATSFSLASRRRRISLCEQSPQIFPGTVSDNLAISGVTDADRQREVLETLGLAEEISGRGGLDLVLGEQGQGLSGGQLQRLAIARALLSGAELLILDEPTSGLDWENARLLIEQLKKLQRRGVAIVMITHDPQLAGFADRNITLG